MSVVTLYLRMGTKRRLVADQVDLSILTPKARALAEAIADSPGHQPLAVLWDTGRLKGDHPQFREIWGHGPRADARAAEPDLRLIASWSAAPPRSSLTAAEWLEHNARSLPHTSWPVAGCESRVSANRRRVPSADAARDDRCLTRSQVLDYTISAGQPMHASGWGLLWRAGHCPQPRHLALDGHFPLWHVDDLDAYLSRDFERWPLTRVAEYLGYTGAAAAGSARKQLSRWGLQAIGRAPGWGGESLYAADQVQAAHASRPGRGNRTPRQDS